MQTYRYSKYSMLFSSQNNNKARHCQQQILHVKFTTQKKNYVKK